MISNPVAAYRRWRRRSIYDRVRRELYLVTEDPAVLSLTDAELNEGTRQLAEAWSHFGITTEAAAEALRNVGRDP